MRRFWEAEYHEAQAKHSLMAVRNRTRNILILSTAALVPLSVLVLIVTLLSWHHGGRFPEFLWALAASYPFLGGVVLLIALQFHGRGYYKIAAGCAIGVHMLVWGAYLLEYCIWIAGVIA